MMRTSCLLVMVCLCVPGIGSVCWDSATCRDLNDKEKLLDCVHQCLSVIQTELPGVKGDDLFPSMLLAGLISKDKTDWNPNARSDERRSYAMEHFRWGKPAGEKHPPAKAVEGSGPYDTEFPHQARRQLSSIEEVNLQSLQGQRLLKAMVSPKTHILPSSQERKDGTYRMSHFRWGSPPASKRSDGGFTKLWEEEDPLAKIFSNIMEQDEGRRRGQ